MDTAPSRKNQPPGNVDTMETAPETPAVPRDRRWRGTNPLPVPAGMETMTRDEVAALWGVTARVVTRYVDRGTVQRYVKYDGRGVPRVVFSAAQAQEVHAARQAQESTGPQPVADAGRGMGSGPPPARPRRW